MRPRGTATTRRRRPPGACYTRGMEPNDPAGPDEDAPDDQAADSDIADDGMAPLITNTGADADEGDDADAASG